jgi:hypothetical protein
MSSTSAAPTDSWRFVGSPQWIDGTRGRLLRSFYEPTEDEEIIAADLSLMTRRLQGVLRKIDDRLSWVLTGDQLFHVLMDHVVTRIRFPGATTLAGPARKAPTPVGWSEEDEQIWQEWLGAEVLSPERLERCVFGEEPRVWELRLGFGNLWRREVTAYLSYLVHRSREILREIDPRPIVPEEEGGLPTDEEGGRRR